MRREGREEKGEEGERRGEGSRGEGRRMEGRGGLSGIVAEEAFCLKSAAAYAYLLVGCVEVRCWAICVATSTKFSAKRRD